ncbi:hypothetical protein [Paenibacillus alvei]|uniref:hypothetical protein n=1 Tax=Paenibacillus alvei TaxID=44250 RepID=UPI002280099C|nr:hypothetical protein [Paenibacillus alvei]
MEENEYKLTVCGCGPAGVSPLIYMEEYDLLEPLLKEGVCLIDKSNSVGSGNIKNYKITANSLGKVFTEIFTNPQSPLLKYLTDKESCKELSHFKDDPPNLPLVGKLMDDIGDYLSEKIKSFAQSKVLLNTTVTQIHTRLDGRYDIVFNYGDSKDSSAKLTTEHLLFNLGGLQEFPPFISQKTASSGHVWLSSDFIMGKWDHDLLSLLQRSTNTLNIAVIGASHSAFSILYRLKNHFNLIPGSQIDVNILHKSPLRLFYNSIEEASQAGYHFDCKTDVCSHSGRVNRFSGLRYDSFQLARDVLDGKYNNVRLSPVSKSGRSDEHEYINRADIIIVSTGYKKNRVQIFDKDGSLLSLAMDSNGVITNNYCNPILQNGRALQNFYTYGLGAGQRVNAENGGETSYTGRIDGIWFYQHEVTKRIVPIITSKVKQLLESKRRR